MGSPLEIFSGVYKTARVRIERKYGIVKYLSFLETIRCFIDMIPSFSVVTQTGGL